jgi:hypothetical protein
MTLEAPKNIEFEGLMDEVHRYLAAVDVFRAEGREPRWAASGRSESRIAAAPGGGSRWPSPRRC